MPTCKEVTELVTDHAEGNLSVADRLRLRMHLGRCRDCRRYVRQVSATVAALGMMPLPGLSPRLERELLRRFDGWRQTRGP